MLAVESFLSESKQALTFGEMLAGRLVFADGRYYEGEFRDDKYCGRGVVPNTHIANFIKFTLFLF